MLMIQKIVLLTQSDILKSFLSNLEKIQAKLPHILVSTLANHSDELSTDELCKIIYKRKTDQDKRKLFQLCSYTFKLYGYVCKNYPSFLLHNFYRIEHLINTGCKEEANYWAILLYEIAEKIEDYDTLIKVLRFFTQQSFILENKNDTLYYLNKLEETQKYQNDLFQIYKYLRMHLNYKIKESLNPDEVCNHLSFFQNYVHSKSLSVSILARFGYYYTLSFASHPEFYTEQSKKQVNELIKDQQNHYYIKAHFADDILTYTKYLQIKQLLNESNDDELQKKSYQLILHESSLLFWNSYINFPVIISLSIQASYFLNRYGFIYRNNKEIPDNVLHEMNTLLHVTKELIDRYKNSKPAIHARLINLIVIYASFLILGSSNDVKKAIHLLEKTLIEHQQIYIQKLYDSLFCILIMAYFSKRDYEKVCDCYKRYEKLTAKAVKNIENDLSIKAIYYVSQWLQTNRNQYINKIGKSLQLAYQLKLQQPIKLIHDLIQYFKIPNK